MSEQLQRNISNWILGLVFIGAGVGHFVMPEFFVAIVPPYLPYPLELVYISGVFEILGGVGVLIPQVRKWAGWGLILLLVAVFPANIHMTLNPQDYADFAPTWGLYLRLPLQFLAMWWVYQSAIRQPDSDSK